MALRGEARVGVWYGIGVWYGVLGFKGVGVDILSVPFLHSFEWLMVQSMDLHALLPSLLGGLLGLLLFPTSAFYFHSSNKPFYLKHFLYLKVFYLQHAESLRRH